MKPSAKTTATLPNGYEVLERLDLKENKKLFWLVNGLATAVAVALLLLGMLLTPFSTLYTADGQMYLRLGALIVGSVLYIFLHEAIHGIFMRAFSGVRPHFGMTSVYAYAGSTAYFSRRHYLIVGLSPIVIWGLVLAILTPLVPTAWFWVVYIIQIMNLSGAAGDLYVTVHMLRMPPDILVQDSGVAMTVYSRIQK